MMRRALRRFRPHWSLVLLVVGLLVFSPPLAWFSPDGAVASGPWRVELSQPGPGGHGLAAVSVADLAHAWAVGRDGVILFWDGLTWSHQESGTSEDLNGVYALDAAHAWAVGNLGTVRFWNGSGWEPQENSDTHHLYGVYAASPTEAWAVGDQGTILVLKGGLWSRLKTSVTAKNLRAISGVDAANVWVAGEGGVVLWYNGLSWSAPKSGTSRDLTAVYALDAGHVWAAGNLGAVRFRGRAGWVAQASGTGANLRGVFGAAPGKAWAVGDGGKVIAWNGTGWTAQASGTASNLAGIAGLDRAHVWAVGANSTILYYGNPVTVASPNGGEVIRSGGTYTITWNAVSAVAKSNLKYSLDGGATWKPIRNGVPGRSYAWSVPRLSANCGRVLIKVIGYTKGGAQVGSDVSDLVAQIEVVKLLSPNGGEDLTSGTLQEITWQTNGTVSPVTAADLYYTLDGGKSWTKITPSADGTGSFPWTVAPVKVEMARCKVRVVLRGDGQANVGSDASDNFFTVKPGP